MTGDGASASGSGDGSRVKRARLGSRYSKLVDAFNRAGHSILTACSEKELFSLFSFVKPEMQRHVYDCYTQVVAAVHKGSKEEFEIICNEMKIKDVLCELDKASSKHEVIDEAVPCPINPHVAVFKDTLAAKISEAKELTALLQKEENLKAQVAAELHILHKEAQDLDEIKNGDDNDSSAARKLRKALQTAEEFKVTKEEM